MFLLLISLTAAAYFYGRKNLISPWFLLCFACTVGYIFVMINATNWQFKASGKFLLYVLTALLAFGLGTALLRVNVSADAKIACSGGALVTERIKKRYPVNFLMCISLAGAFVYCYSMLSAAGDAKSISDKLRLIYDKIVYESYSPGILTNQMLEVVVAIAYVSVFRLYLKIFTPNDKISVAKLLLPLVAFMSVVVMSTDRNIFIRFVFYASVLGALFFMAANKDKKVNLKILLFALTAVGVAIIAFFLLGVAKQYKSGLFRSLSIYIGSGLNNFNLWIQNFNDPLLYGRSTFLSVIGVVNRVLEPLGVSVSQPINRIDEFISYTSANGYEYSSNVYTALKPYVEDYGYFGCFIIPFVSGIFFQWLYKNAVEKRVGWTWLLYCALVYPVMYFCILEQFIRRFHLGYVYEVFWLLAIYFFAFGTDREKYPFRSVLDEMNKRSA